MDAGQNDDVSTNRHLMTCLKPGEIVGVLNVLVEIGLEARALGVEVDGSINEAGCGNSREQGDGAGRRFGSGEIQDGSGFGGGCRVRSIAVADPTPTSDVKQGRPQLHVEGAGNQ